MPIAGATRSSARESAKPTRRNSRTTPITQTGPDAEGRVLLHKRLRDPPETLADIDTTMSGGSDWYMSIKEGDPNSSRVEAGVVQPFEAQGMGYHRAVDARAHVDAEPNSESRNRFMRWKATRSCSSDAGTIGSNAIFSSCIHATRDRPTHLQGDSYCVPGHGLHTNGRGSAIRLAQRPIARGRGGYRHRPVEGTTHPGATA